MAMNDFLSSLAWGGPKYGSSPLSAGAAGVNTASPYRINAPFYFAEAIKQASAPGGALSDLLLNQAYTGQVEGILARERQRQGQGQAALAQSGLSQQSIAGIYGEEPLRAQSELAALRGSMESDLQGRRFDAMSQLAGVLSQSEAQRAQYATESKMRDLARKGQRMGSLSSLLGLGGAFIAGGINPFSALSGLFGGGGPTPGAQGFAAGAGFGGPPYQQDAAYAGGATLGALAGNPWVFNPAYLWGR